MMSTAALAWAAVISALVFGGLGFAIGYVEGELRGRVAESKRCRQSLYGVGKS